MALSQKDAKRSTTNAPTPADAQRRERQALQQQFRNYRSAGHPLVITNAVVKGKNAVFVVLQDAFYCEKCGNLSQGASCGNGCGSVANPVTTTATPEPSPSGAA